MLFPCCSAVIAATVCNDEVLIMVLVIRILMLAVV